ESVTFPNGTVSLYKYDSLNRLTNLTHTASNNVLLASYSYTLHVTGRRRHATEVLLNTDDSTYVTNTFDWAYDGMYRLTNETATSSSAGLNYSDSYLYDLVGNRIKKVHGSQTTTNQFNANDELTSAAST